MKTNYDTQEDKMIVIKKVNGKYQVNIRDEERAIFIWLNEAADYAQQFKLPILLVI